MQFAPDALKSSAKSKGVFQRALMLNLDRSVVVSKSSKASLFISQISPVGSAAIQKRVDETIVLTDKVLREEVEVQVLTSAVAIDCVTDAD
jgi:hypothetical protein